MHNVQFMNILHSCKDLLEKSACFGFFYASVLYYVIKQLALRCIFHNQVQLLRSFNNLIQLNNIGMSNKFKNMNLSWNPLHICDILNSLLLKDFHCNLDDILAFLNLLFLL